MKRASKFLATAGATFCLVAGSNGHAAVFTYNVAGTFADGEILGGSFSLNDSGVYPHLSNIDITISNSIEHYTALYYTYNPSPDGGVGRHDFGFSRPSAFFQPVYISFLADPVQFSAGIIPDQVLNVNLSGYNRTGSIIALRSGTITAATNGAVPEPGTWLTMILGFGAIGFAMRRRQRQAVNYNFA